MMNVVKKFFVMVILAVVAVAPALAQEAQPATPKKPTLEGKLNINTATVEQIDMLPGMSKKKAEAVVEYRTANGNFKTLEDLMKVKGIKQKTIDRIKDYIIFEGQTTLKRKDKA
jgi:competence protein ComEA